MKFKFATSLISGLAIFASVRATPQPEVEKMEFFKFKQLMMYFNEPLLQGAKAKGFLFDDKSREQSFEGAESLTMAKTIKDAIKASNWKDPDATDINDFAKYLEYGIDVIEKMKSFQDIKKDWETTKSSTKEPQWQHFTEEAKKFQDILKKELDSKKKLILPFGWSGKSPHAINLIMEVETKDGKDLYKLVVVNTGDGLNHHFSYEDSNNVHPWLNQLWIEFKDIEETILFDNDTAWFAQMMIKLQDEESVKEGEAVAKSAANYFYSSVLSNFKDYVNPKIETDKLSPAQRSGSCTLSSLMASYLYYANSLITYNHNRVRLGHKLLEDFLTKNASNGSFKTLITDGFDLVPRKLFEVTASALAQQLFTYLEVKFQEFKNSALIGDGRSDWISTKKEEAVKVLSEHKNTETLDLLKKTVEYCKKVLEQIKINTINNDTNMIKVEDSLKSLGLKIATESIPDLGPVDKVENNFYDLLKIEIQRPDETYNDLYSLWDRLKKCLNIKTIAVHFCALDAFRMAKRNWWTLLDDISDKDEAFESLDLLTTLTENYLGSKDVFTSFDDIVFLAHLQIGAWKSAVIYDERAGDVLGLKNFSPPYIIHRQLSSQLFENKAPIISGVYVNLLIKTTYSPKALSELSFLLDEYLKLGPSGSNVERFLGPGDFLDSPRTTEWKAANSIKKIKTFPQNQKMYDLMMQQADIAKAIKTIKQSKAQLKTNKWSTAEHADFQIFMTSLQGHDSLKNLNLYSHFYKLWDQMIWLYQSLALRPVSSSNSKRKCAFKSVDEQEDVDKLAFNNLQSSVETFYPGQDRFDIKVIPECHKLKTSKDPNIFFKLRHSQALSSPASIINFESWLNYIKGAADPSIFDHPYFMYLTEFILNVPRIDLVSPYKVDQSVKATYPGGISKRHVRDVFESLIRLINMDLNYIVSKQGRLELAEKTKLIKRPVNIAIPLVKFIGRVDNDSIINGYTASNLLAKIYMSFFKFSPVLSNLGLEDTDISIVNLVLAQITDMPIRNGKTFIDKLRSLGFPSGVPIFRRSLSRVHWFITKMFYIRDPNPSHVVDLYNYGFIYRPISKNEIPIMDFLLKKLFLVKHDPSISKWTSIEYNDNGDIVRCTSTSNMLVAIQMSSGKVVKNGNLVVEKSLILNDPNFGSFFAKEDKNDAIKGEISKIGSTVLYTLNDFKLKGNLIVFVCPSGYNCQVYRKYMDKWHIWKNNANDFKTSLDYQWIHGYKLFLYDDTHNGGSLYQAIVIADNKGEPMLRVKYDSVNGNSIYINGLNDDSDPWRLLADQKKDADALDKHLKTFTDTGRVLAKDKSDNLVVIYPGLRLKDDLDRPLCLVQVEEDLTTHKSKFIIKNSSGLEVVSEQSITDTGIKGTLIAKNNDNQKFILVPIQNRKHDGGKEKPVLVEKIQLQGNKAAPQSRFESLLLAFYLIRAREFTLGRKLLQPFKSINQNEAFHPEELKVLAWITNINGGGPEADALKLIAYIHIQLNEQKFPLEYKEDKDDQSEEGLLKRERSKFKSEASKKLNDIVLNYFSSIRDLPEKLYIYRIFPETIRSDMLKNLLNKMNSGSGSISVSSDIRPKIVCEKSSDAPSISALSEKKIADGTIYEFLKTLIENPTDTGLEWYMKVKPKLMHKVADNRSTATENEMIVYCASKDSSIWTAVAKQYLDYCKKPEKPEESTTAIIKTFKDAIEKCIGAYANKDKNGSKEKKEFKHFTLEEHKQAYKANEKTKPDKIIATFKTDLKNNLSQRPFNDIKELKLVEKNDLEFFVGHLDKLRGLVKLDKNADPINFEFADISKVLSKLSGSIADFIKTKGKVLVSEITLEKPTIDDLRQFNLYLEGRIYQINTKLNDMKATLLDDTKDKLNTSVPHFMEEMNRYLHGRKEKTFEHLFSCYQKLSVDCIQAKFPQLEGNKCNEVMEKTLEFYSHKIFLEFLKTLSDAIEKFINSSNKKIAIPVDDISLFLDEAQKISDFNSRLKKPVILNFEYRSKKYRLRAEQVKDIEMLTTVDSSNNNSFKSAVIQRMMAAGKTLVLGTISVVQKALEKDKLSILVPPTSLYQSNLSAMQQRTNDYFKTKGQNFIFPRLQFSTSNEFGNVLIPFLESIYQNIVANMEAKDYYVLSPDSLQAFLNAYIEMLNYASYKYDDNVKNALQKYSKIYDLFRSKGSIILDEIDMTMDPKKELNFPTMENEPFNLLAATLMTDLIEFSVFHEDVKAIGLDIYSNNQSSLTSENYQLYMAKLIEYIESQLKKSNSLWSERLLDKDVKDILSTEKIIAFLKNPDIAYMKSWIKELYQKEKKVLADTLIIIKMELYQGLKSSLNASANLNYGAAGSGRAHILYAIPFLAANTPSPSSEFADRWETLNKTLLMFASVPCTRIIAKNMIGYIRKSAIRETSLSVAIEDTQTYKTAQTLIKNLKIMNLNDQDDTHVDMIHGALKKRSPTAIRLLFSYAVDEIFSEMKFPVEQITSNALNMASMFNSVQGYSGTIDNVNILPREVVDGAYQNHMENEKNNGGISYKLINDSQDKSVHELTDEILKCDAGKIIENMVDGFRKNNTDAPTTLSAIIDAGAFFKNFKNQSVAEEIHKHFGEYFQAVLYYNEESNQVEYVKQNGAGAFEVGKLTNTDPDYIQKTTQVSLSKRFTFYDQRHITGSDILQPKNANAIMTIGTRVLLRDILQGTLRMRQFMTSQKVHLVTAKSAANFYYSKCSAGGKGKQTEVKVVDLLTLGAFNEDEKQQMENEKLAYVKIDNEIRRFVLEEITRVIEEKLVPKDIISIWFSSTPGPRRNVRDLFVRFIKENPIDWMVTPVKKDPATVLKNYASDWVKTLTEIAPKIKAVNPKFDFGDSATDSGKSFEKLKEVFETLTAPFDKTNGTRDTLLAFLGEKIVERSVLTDSGSEVQMQVFTQTLSEFDLEKMSKTYGSDPKPAPRKPFDINQLIKFVKEASVVPKPGPKNSGVVSLNEVLFDPAFTDIYRSMSRSSILSKGRRIFVTSDLLNIIDVQPNLPYKIYSQYTWEASHILVQVLPKLGGIRIILLSTEAANEVRTKLMDKAFSTENSALWICDLHGDITLSTDPDFEPGESIFDVVPLSKHLFYDALVFNGSFDQIVSNPLMKKIYTEKWLKSESFQLRAKFLLLRMHNLAEKAKKTFDTSNPDMEILNRASQGDKDALNSMKSSSSAFKKTPVSEEEEAEFFVKKGIERPKPADSDVQGGSLIDASAIFTEITNEPCPSIDALQNAGVGMNFSLPNVSLQHESNADSSTVDEFAVNKKKKRNSKYDKVIDDPDDLNIGSDDDANQDKAMDYSFIIVILFGVAAFSSAGYYYYRRTRKSNVQISPEPVLSEKANIEKDGEAREDGEAEAGEEAESDEEVAETSSEQEAAPAQDETFPDETILNDSEL